MVPAQVLAVFSFFRQLLNHAPGMTQYMPWDRALFPWVSVDDPVLWQGDCLQLFSTGRSQGTHGGVSGARQDGSAPVPSGSLLHKARLSLRPGLSGMPLSAVGKALRLLGTQMQASWGLEVWQV